MTCQRASLVFRFRFAGSRVRLNGRPRSGTARRALGAGLAALVAVSAALAAAVETVRPEWRDPEYGHRLRAVRRLQAERPDRPLVLAFGSSRVQMGVSPAAMGFADGPGAPLVYNFGYRSGSPLLSWLLLDRVLGAGVRPRAAVLFLAPGEVAPDRTAEQQFQLWPARLSGADRRQLESFSTDPGALLRSVWPARLNPAAAHRVALISNVFPEAQTDVARFEHRSWETMDGYGFVPFSVESVSEQNLRPLLATARTGIDKTNAARPRAVSDPTVRAFVDRCRAEGIAVAVAWAPEAPWYREALDPAVWAGVAADTAALTGEWGVPVFPAPEHLGDTDFVDGYHLAPDGAAKYSRWLADTHLKPWLSDALR